MPMLRRACGAAIRYELMGAATAPPVLLIAPGGMQSSIAMWALQPYNPLARLPHKFRLIAMDQRNAGQSTGPLQSHAGWATFEEDQLALLDHLHIERCLLLGMCIGPSYMLQLMKAQPERFPAAVMLQPIGLAKHTTERVGWDGLNTQATTHWFGRWAEQMAAEGRADGAELQRLYASMFDGRNFVFTALRSELLRVTAPLLVLMGQDMYHPSETARELARLAPNAELVEAWREPDSLPAAAVKIEAFLEQHAELLRGSGGGGEGGGERLEPE